MVLKIQTNNVLLRGATKALTDEGFIPMALEVR